MSVTVQVAFLTGFVLILTSAVLIARRLLLPSGNVAIHVNDGDEMIVPAGDKLLRTLAEKGVFLPAACGGRGSCGQCRLIVTDGGGQALLTEMTHISSGDLKRGWRLACMVAVRDDLWINLPESALAARRWSCRVKSRRFLSPYQLELVLGLESGEDFRFEPGAYVLLEAPPGETRLSSIDIDENYVQEWERNNLISLVATRDVAVQRAYSMANSPHEKGIVRFVIRIALPPAHAPAGTPAGMVSSYAFGLGIGDDVTISGPFGAFRATDSDREMVFIGGGAGIAPLHSIILDQLEKRKTGRKIAFFYGVRSLRDLCYAEEFEALATRFDNFSWQVALSDPQPGDDWNGPVGFIHSVLDRQFLGHHPAPEEVEYYVCGPPVMSSAVIGLLEDVGVDREHIFIDDFGG